jgi:hypothetical protein
MRGDEMTSDESQGGAPHVGIYNSVITGDVTVILQNSEVVKEAKKYKQLSKNMLSERDQALPKMLKQQDKILIRLLKQVYKSLSAKKVSDALRITDEHHYVNKQLADVKEDLMGLIDSLNEYQVKDKDLMFIGFVGGFSSGKTSILNELSGLKRKTGKQAVDTNITYIVHPTNKHRLITSAKKIGGLSRVIETTNNSELKDIVLVDTPGGGEEGKKNMDIAVRDFLPICDIIVFVKWCHRTFSEEEKTLLSSLQKELDFLPRQYVLTGAKHLRKNDYQRLTNDNIDHVEYNELVQNLTSQLRNMGLADIGDEPSFTPVETNLKGEDGELDTFNIDRMYLQLKETHNELNENPTLSNEHGLRKRIYYVRQCRVILKEFNDAAKKILEIADEWSNKVEKNRESLEEDYGKNLSPKFEFYYIGWAKLTTAIDKMRETSTEFQKILHASISKPLKIMASKKIHETVALNVLKSLKTAINTSLSNNPDPPRMDELYSSNVQQLKLECKRSSLSQTGVKRELIERLWQAKLEKWIATIIPSTLRYKLDLKQFNPTMVNRKLYRFKEFSTNLELFIKSMRDLHSEAESFSKIVSGVKKGLRNDFTNLAYKVQAAVTAMVVHQTGKHTYTLLPDQLGNTGEIEIDSTIIEKMVPGGPEIENMCSKLELHIRELEQDKLELKKMMDFNKGLDMVIEKKFTLSSTSTVHEELCKIIEDDFAHIFSKMNRTIQRENDDYKLSIKNANSQFSESKKKVITEAANSHSQRVTGFSKEKIRDISTHENTLSYNFEREALNFELQLDREIPPLSRKVRNNKIASATVPVGACAMAYATGLVGIYPLSALVVFPLLRLWTQSNRKKRRISELQHESNNIQRVHRDAFEKEEIKIFRKYNSDVSNSTQQEAIEITNGLAPHERNRDISINRFEQEFNKASSKTWERTSDELITSINNANFDSLIPIILNDLEEDINETLAAAFEKHLQLVEESDHFDIVSKIPNKSSRVKAMLTKIQNKIISFVDESESGKKSETEIFREFSNKVFFEDFNIYQVKVSKIKEVMKELFVELAAFLDATAAMEKHIKL